MVIKYGKKRNANQMVIKWMSAGYHGFSQHLQAAVSGRMALLHGLCRSVILSADCRALARDGQGTELKEPEMVFSLNHPFWFPMFILPTFPCYGENECSKVFEQVFEQCFGPPVLFARGSAGIQCSARRNCQSTPTLSGCVPWSINGAPPKNLPLMFGLTMVNHAHVS